MTKRLSLFTIFLFLAMYSMADTLTIDKAKTFSLPVVEVETVNQEEPTCDYVFAPKGADGISITNATKVPGRLKIWSGDKLLFDTGDYLKGESGMTLKIRGNTSAYFNPLKPFKVKLQKKGDLLLRGNKKYNDKDWVLLTDGIACVYNKVGYIVGSCLSMSYTPHGKYVNLFVNGNYRGIYMIGEQVNRNNDCRVNVDKKEGYIIERDSYWWNEPVYFESAKGLKYTFKYPDEEDVTSSQIDYIKTRIDKFEQSVDDGTYDEYINVHSFAKWLLAMDMMGIRDAGGSNLYFSLYSDTSKLQIPCMWDFDSAFKTEGNWSSIHTNNTFFIFPKLLQNSNPAFLNAYIDEWDRVGKQAMDNIVDSLEAFKASDDVAGIVKSQPYALVRWGDTADGEPPMTSILDTYISWIKQRKVWLSTAIDNLRTSTGISFAADNKKKNPEVYNLQGVKLNSLPKQKGIYIVGNRKVIVK